MNKFTPGPWKIHANAHDNIEVVVDRYPIALLNGYCDDDELAANARLIAAAPMLYEALVNADYAVWYMANNGLEDMIDWEERFNQLTEAIALVKGE